ncbi:uncharacterized protein BYT42DRAFT_644100 [Radiomyces spectabilis]|uniref:uncharacterized protein n=1 Tax=Radiomyces spectabilis TaxID=64574 RepID=UPI002220B94E|nr:uncharacterized protein BYT42DRAFT_644100 [Radiomyces spectabilis]KAI8381280.1 hypothetical protein BYT42DRAFT_644100 [Radiomyces spectabilis]
MIESAQVAIYRYPVVLFTRTDYPECMSANELLKKTFGFDPYVLFLDQIPEGPEIEDFLAQYDHQRSVTNVFIAGKYVGNFEAIVQLDQSGELEEKLE